MVAECNLILCKVNEKNADVGHSIYNNGIMQSAHLLYGKWADVALCREMDYFRNSTTDLSGPR